MSSSHRPNGGLGGAPQFWDVPLPELLDRLGATPAGLGTAEARRRLGRYGRNEVGRAPGVPAVLELLGRLLNPLVLVLLVAGAVSAAFGEVVNSGLIAAIVAIS